MSIALEDRNFIGAARRKAERERPLPTVTSGASAWARRVKRYLGHWIAPADAWHQIAYSLTRRDHRAVGLAGWIRARHVNVSALLNGRIAIRIDIDTGWQALVHATKIDDQHAVDEYESVVVPKELQLELAIVSKQVASLDGEPGVMKPPLRGSDPGAIRVLTKPHPRIDARRKAGREDVLVPPAAISRAE